MTLTYNIRIYRSASQTKKYICFVQASNDHSIPEVHGLHRTPLPVEDLLRGHGGRVTLGEHWDGDVDSEPPPGLDHGHDLVHDLAGDGVGDADLAVHVPRVGAAHEVLVLDQDEVFRISYCLHVRPVGHLL